MTDIAHKYLARQILSCPLGMPEWLWSHGKWKIHFYPEQRFNLKCKRSFLPETLNHTGTKIFVRMPNWLGDVVMALPILRAIRKARPDMEFWIMAKPCYIELIKYLRLGEQFVPVHDKLDLSFVQKLFELRRKFPECHLLFTNSLRGDLESLLIGAPQRFGCVIGKTYRPVLSHYYSCSLEEFNSTHLTHTWGNMVKKFGLKEKISFKSFKILNRPKKLSGKIGIAIGSSNEPNKRWSAEYWIEFIKLIMKSHPELQIFLYGTVNDYKQAKNILAECADFGIQSLIGKTNILELAREFSSCNAVIGCDSGAVHLSSAVGTPTLAIFGPTNPKVTAPCFDTPKVNHVALQGESLSACKPQDVVKSFDSLLLQTTK